MTENNEPLDALPVDALMQHENSKKNVKPKNTTVVFTSGAKAPLQKNSYTNDAVSDRPVSRSPEVRVSNEIEPISPQEKLENLQVSIDKAEDMLASAEKRQEKIEGILQKSELLLEQVSRINEALTLDDSLRQRIDATLARTKNLRRELK